MTIQTFKRNVFPVQAKLFRLAKTLLPEEEDAEDTVQEALLKLWQNRQNLTNYRSIEALAMVITKNLCFDKLKSSHRQRVVPLSPTTDAVGRDNPYQQAEQSDSARLLQQLIAQLPEQQRLVIHLRDVEEYSYEEMEQLTGMCVNNIRVALSRARRSVREMYTKINAYGS